jgi:glycosyltransferase involved in cell wall biosynthesis
MRVVLDATLWDEPATGISVYSHQLAAAMKQSGQELELWGGRRTGRVRRSKSRTRFMLEELPRWLRDEPPDVFHAVANFNLPLTRSGSCRFVLTVHDLIPLLLPETVSSAYRWQFRLWLTRSVQLADAIVCDSDATRLALVERFPQAESKALTVHLGVDHVDRVPRADATTGAWIDALGLPERWVLYAGAIDARKNVELVADAVLELKRRGRAAALVLAGQRWFGAGAIERKLEAARVEGVDIRPLGHLDSTVFYELMRRAPVFAFPSRYEGFGLPPLEAMRLGTPAVVSNGGSLPEVVGDGAQVVGVDDAGGLADALDSVLSDAKVRERWVAAGRQRAAQFTWARTAAQMVKVYR